MENKLLLVDGSNLLFQMYFGMPARIVGKSGEAVHGILGFCGALLKMLRRESPTHVVVVFDGEHENERIALDPAYKSNRPDYHGIPEEETPFSQLPGIKQVLDALGIRHIETTDCESDDIIAAYALTQNVTCAILSMDSDFFQLVRDGVSVLRYRGAHTVTVTPSYIREKLGILPSQYADYKALVGDASDNIGGIRGIGPKRAARLLADFGSLDAILARSNEILPPSVRTEIQQNSEKLKTNYAIIRLTDRAALPFSLSELTYTPTDTTTTTLLRALDIL